MAAGVGESPRLGRSLGLDRAALLDAALDEHAGEDYAARTAHAAGREAATGR